MVWFQLAVARVWPSGLNATAVTVLSWGQDRQLLSLSGPEPSSVVIASGRNQLTIWAEIDVRYKPVMPYECSQFFPL